MPNGGLPTLKDLGFLSKLVGLAEPRQGVGRSVSAGAG